MAMYRKYFLMTVLAVFSAASQAVAGIDANVWDLETPLLETLQSKQNAKIAPCEKLDLFEDIEYRDCLIDAAMFSLSPRDKFDRSKTLFDNVWNKIDVALQPGAAMKIAERAVEGLKTETDVKYKSTYYQILTNLMQRLPKDEEDFRPVFTYLKEQKIEASEDIVKDRHARGLKTAVLSEELEVILAKKISKNSVEVSE